MLPSCFTMKILLCIPGSVILIFHDPSIDRNDVEVKYFGVSYKNSIFYISTKPGIKVIKQNIDEGINHQKLPESQMVNNHLQFETQGIQVGKYYWIYGGNTGVQNFYNVDNVVGGEGKTFSTFFLRLLA